MQTTQTILIYIQHNSPIVCDYGEAIKSGSIERLQSSDFREVITNIGLLKGLIDSYCFTESLRIPTRPSSFAGFSNVHLVDSSISNDLPVVLATLDRFAHNIRYKQNTVSICTADNILEEGKVIYQRDKFTKHYSAKFTALVTVCSISMIVSFLGVVGVIYKVMCV